MSRFALLPATLSLAVALALATPAPAQAEDTPGLRGLLEQMLEAVDPFLRDLAEKLGDLSGWHAPEVLPNGDILIRRRHPADQAPDGSSSGEVLEL